MAWRLSAANSLKGLKSIVTLDHRIGDTKIMALNATGTHDDPHLRQPKPLRISHPDFTATLQQVTH
jgi:hypothetical protein